MPANSNSVEIVISASDRASGVIQSIAGSLGFIGQAAQTAATPVRLLGATITNALLPASRGIAELGLSLLNPFTALQTVVNPVLQAFNAITGSVSNLNQLFAGLNSNPVLNTAFASILESASEQVENLDTSLSERIGAIGSASAGVFSGIGFDVTALTASFSGLGAVFISTVAPAIDKTFNTLNRTVSLIESVPAKLNGVADAIAGVFEPITGFNEPLEVLDLFRGLVGGVTSGLFQLTQEVAFFTAGLDALKQFVVSGPFEILVGQNIRLQEQLLATRASIVSTNSVLDAQGQKITDPTRAILSLGPEINKQIQSIRQGSLELVGVTSNQLVDTFQIIAGQVGNIGLSLDEASQLTLSVAAALGTLGLPLEQSRQEITSILMATVDQNSVLAKTLGITNQQVLVWKSQGRIYDELTNRLKAFRAGNALGAQSINGLLSNVQEYLDEIGRLAGAQLLQPIVDQLNLLYQTIKTSRDFAAKFVSGIVSDVKRAGLAVTEIISTVFGQTSGILAKIPQYLFRSLADFLSLTAKTIKEIIPLFAPVFKVFTSLLQLVGGLGGPFLELFLKFKVGSIIMAALIKGFSVLVNLLPGVGDILFYLGYANNGLISSFAGLNSVLGPGAAGFLLLGKYMAAIPGLASLWASQIPIFGKVIAALTPAVASFGIQLVGLSLAFPAFGTALGVVVSRLPVFAAYIAPLASSIIPGLGSNIISLATSLSTYASATAIATAANAKFYALMQVLGRFIIQQVLHIGLMVAGLAAAVYLLDEFILKNEGLQQVLIAVGKTIQSVAETIKKTLLNPIVLSTIAVVGLSTAIKSGLILALFSTVKAVGAVVVSQLPAWATLSTTSLIALSTALRTTTITFSGLATVITSGLSTIIPGLSALFSTGSGGVLISTFTQLSAVIGRVSGQALFSLGNAIRGLGFVSLGRNIQIAAVQLQLYATTLLSTTTASRGLFSISTLLSISFASITAAAKSAYTAIAAFATTVAPIVILVTAIGTVIEAFSEYAVLTNASSKATKEFENSIAEATKKVDLLTQANKKLREAGQVSLKINYDDTRLKEIQNGQNALAKTFEFLRSVANKYGFLSTVTGGKIQFMSYAQAQLNKELEGAQDGLFKAGNQLQKFRDANKEAIALEQERVDLTNQRAEAEAKGNTGEVTRIDSRIKSVEEEIQVRKDLVDAAIKGVEGIATFNETAPLQASILKEYKEFRNELDNIGKTKIIPPDLPRLGTSFEQLQVLAENALKVLESSTGTQEEFKQKAESLIQVTGEQLKLNQITTSEAIKRYKVIATNVNAEKDVQIKAIEAITAAYKQESAKQIEIIQLRQKEIEASLASGRINELEGSKQLTAARRAELEKQLDDLKKAANEENQQRRANLKSTLAEVDRQIQTAREKMLGAPDPSDTRDILGLQKQRQQAVSELGKIASTLSQTREKAIAAATNSYKPQLDAALNYIKQIDDQIERARESIAAGVEPPTPLQVANLSQLQQQREAVVRAVGQIQQSIQGAGDKADINFKKQIDVAREKIKSLDSQIAVAQTKARKPTATDEEKKSAQKDIDQATKLRTAALKADQTQQESFNKSNLAQQSAVQAQITTLNSNEVKEQGEIRIKELERSQQKAIDVTVEAENRRLEQIEILQNKGVLTQSQADEQRAESSRRLAEVELKTERDKLSQLEKFPAYPSISDEQERQAQIRASRLKTQQLTQKLLQSEQQAYESHIAVIKDALQRQIDLYGVLEKALETRNKLLEAGKNLAASTSDFIVGELSILSEIETSESRRKQLAQATANIRLRALIIQQQYEQKSLEIQQQQNELALQRQIIENQIAQARNTADIAKAEQELTTAREEKAPASVVAALENSLSAISKNSAPLQKLGEILQQQLQDLPNISGSEREVLRNRQNLAQRQAELEIAKTLPPGIQRQVVKSIKEAIAQDLGETSFESLIKSASITSAATEKERFGVDRTSVTTPFTTQLSDTAAQQLQQSADGSTEAARQTQEFIKKFGTLKDGSTSTSLPSDPKAAAQTQEFIKKFGTGGLGEGLLQTAPTPQGLKLPDGFAGLQLPPLDLKRLGLSFENSGALFTSSVNRLVQTLEKSNLSKPVTVNLSAPITVNSQSDRAAAQKTGDSILDQLEKVVDRAVNVGRSQLAY